MQPTLEYVLKGDDRPHLLTIRPPRLRVFEWPADAPVIFPWLDKLQFRPAAEAGLPRLRIYSE